MSRALGAGLLLLAACVEPGLELGAGPPVVPAPAGPLRVEARGRSTGAPLPDLEALFVGPGGIERTRTDGQGRAASSDPATDLHVFRGDAARSVLGAPTEIEVVFPEAPRARERGATVQGSLRTSAEVVAARLVALTPEVDLDGWAAGAPDPEAGGLPTHLPRVNAGRADFAVVLGPRATGVAALLFGQGPDPVGVAAAPLPPLTAGDRVGPIELLARPGPREVRVVRPLPPGFDALSLYAELELPGGRLRAESGRQAEDGGLVFTCPASECGYALELRRRADVGDDRGVTVEARGLRGSAAAIGSAPFLPAPRRFERRDRELRFARGEETALALTLRPGGAWRVLILDGRERVDLPVPEGPDPLRPGEPGLDERTDLEGLPRDARTDVGWVKRAARSATARW